MTMNELFNYEHAKSIKGCTPEKEHFKVAISPEVENKVSLELKWLQTLKNTTGLISRRVTKNQQVYPNGRKRKFVSVFVFLK